MEDIMGEQPSSDPIFMLTKSARNDQASSEDKEKVKEVKEVNVETASPSRDSSHSSGPSQQMRTGKDQVVTRAGGDHLPAELLGYAQEFQTHMLYFFNSNNAIPPASLTSLLDDIMKVGEEKGKWKADSKARKEVLHDQDGRKVCLEPSPFRKSLISLLFKLLFMLSFEGTGPLLCSSRLLLRYLETQCER
jgi:hypothetical protein